MATQIQLNPLMSSVVWGLRTEGSPSALLPSVHNRLYFSTKSDPMASTPLLSLLLQRRLHRGGAILHRYPLPPAPPLLPPLLSSHLNAELLVLPFPLLR